MARFYFDIFWDSNKAHVTDGDSAQSYIIKLHEIEGMVVYGKSWVSARVERYDLGTTPEAIGKLIGDISGVKGVEEIRIKKYQDQSSNPDSGVVPSL